jgi:multidrug efflux system membrane fusion protein
MRPRIRWISCFLVLASALGCGAKAKPRSGRVPVSLAAVVERPMPYVLGATGAVEALETAAVGSQVGGVVTRVAFREGDTVRAGQLLFEIDPRPFHAELDQARAALDRDRARAETARLEADRGQRLFEQSMISQSDWDQKRADAEALAATVRADSGAVNTARLNVEYAAIRAPIAGRTGRVAVHEGDYIKAATSDPLVTIIQPHPMRIRFTIPERDVPTLQRYRNARPRVLAFLDGRDAPAIEGALVFVDNAVDPVSGTLLLKGEFPNRDGRLVPGQFVEVRLVLYVTPRAVVVPTQAVSSGQQGAYVYVVNADSTVTPRPIEVERTVDELAVVSHGLTTGESVVTDGQLRLAPGSKVLVRAPVGGAR